MTDRPEGEHAAVAAVVFDMDGLMLDTESLAARAWHDAARSIGVEFDPAVNVRLVGRNMGDCERLIREHHGERYPVAALIEAWHGAYEAIIAAEGVAVKTGLVELLDWLDARRVPKAVATSTRRTRATGKLTRAGVLSRFDAVVGGDEVARGKPAPDIYLEAAARLGVVATQCIALEDSEPGVEAALAAGMRAIMVPDLLAPSADLRRRAYLVVDSLVEARAHLEALLVQATVLDGGPVR